MLVERIFKSQKVYVGRVWKIGNIWWLWIDYLDVDWGEKGGLDVCDGFGEFILYPMLFTEKLPCETNLFNRSVVSFMSASISVEG